MSKIRHMKWRKTINYGHKIKIYYNVFNNWVLRQYIRKLASCLYFNFIGGSFPAKTFKSVKYWLEIKVRLSAQADSIAMLSHLVSSNENTTSYIRVTFNTMRASSYEVFPGSIAHFIRINWKKNYMPKTFSMQSALH